MNKEMQDIMKLFQVMKIMKVKDDIIFDNESGVFKLIKLEELEEKSK